MSLEQIKNAGILGAGGAGFPTHVKLATGVETILVNGVECEPLIYTDYFLMKTRLEQVVLGAEHAMKLAKAKEVVIAIKKHTAEKLGVKDGEKVGEYTSFRVLPDVYPLGDEIVMIYQALGKLVPPGQLPSFVGVTVINVETAYNIANSIREIPLTEKWLTIGGDIPKPVLVRVPLYTSVAKLFSALGIAVNDDSHVLIDGGPMMGRIVEVETATITKKTKALLILPRVIPAVQNKTASFDRAIKRTSSACCQCTFCTDLCPRQLLGYPLAPHKTLRAVSSGSVQKADDLLTASLCSGCGVCTAMACTQGLCPSVTMGQVKTALGKQKLGFKTENPTKPDPNRDFRMLPVSRLKRRIGVAPFDKLATWTEVTTNQKRYDVRLDDHIGAPAVPLVAVGDSVSAGQILAQAQGMVSLPVHSPISGVVTGIYSKIIEIEVR